MPQSLQYSARTLLLIIPIIALLGMGGIYLLFDNFYEVTLTEDFTENGTSDINNFGIIVSDSHAGNLSLTELPLYKKVIIPYNNSMGEVNVEFNERRSRIIGFYNENANNTNYTTSTVNSYAYENTDNMTAVYNHTDTSIDYFDTGNQSINEALFDLIVGKLNGSSDCCVNMSFYPPPPIIWEDIYFEEIWYEYWTPNASLINKTFDRLYIPFKGTLSPSGRIYVQIYNATTTISFKSFDQSDLYNPSYSILNVLNRHFIYCGEKLTIKVWTNEYVNWWSPVYVAELSPSATNSSMVENFVFLGIPITINHPNRCFYKGWITEKNIIGTQILSESRYSEQQIVFNLTFNLQDFNVTALNIINFSLHINDLFHNLSMSHFIDGNVCFYDYNASLFYNFAYGNIENRTYGLYYPTWYNANFINSDNQICCQIVLRGNASFYMILQNVTFNIWYFDANMNTEYYTTYTLQMLGDIRSSLSVTSSTIPTEYGYYYSEVIVQTITINQTTILETPYRIVRLNETVTIVNLLNRRVIYYFQNPKTEEALDIIFDYYNPMIIVRPYVEERKIEVAFDRAYVYI